MNGAQEWSLLTQQLQESTRKEYHATHEYELRRTRQEHLDDMFLAAQGGCEPQLQSHAAANMRLGNDKVFLIKVVSQCLPFIGYPRSLNALACVNRAADAIKKE